jgi:hypothetical protein
MMENPLGSKIFFAEAVGDDISRPAYNSSAV